ncbi:hypothetical protein X777_07376 [Ooceraea biroi]|uniref:Uncharacterized protein n=1 Tax=Ooceraea biroi TaxID=2015173 RepID=A0A026WBZ2_OOCBI|nr:hypothetical protein X777_07376 [Ooceraea biroi]
MEQDSPSTNSFEIQRDIPVTAQVHAPPGKSIQDMDIEEEVSESEPHTMSV